MIMNKRHMFQISSFLLLFNFLPLVTFATESYHKFLVTLGLYALYSQSLSAWRILRWELHVGNMTLSENGFANNMS